jgi:hypothetical protein
MSSYTAYEKEHMESLRAEGLFVTILGEGDYDHSVKVECRIYVTDVDYETGTTNLLQVYEGEPLRSEEHNQCIGCKAEEGQQRPCVRGSIACPLCGVQTMPYWLRERRYCADFILFGNGPAILFDAEADEGVKPMPPMMGQMIGEALTNFELEFQGVFTPPVSPEEAEEEEEGEEEEDEIPPVNFADFYPPLVSPFEAEDNAARYAERYGFMDSP